MHHIAAKKLAKENGLELHRYRYGKGFYWYLTNPLTTEGITLGASLRGTTLRSLFNDIRSLKNGE